MGGRTQGIGEVGEARMGYRQGEQGCRGALRGRPGRERAGEGCAQAGGPQRGRERRQWRCVPTSVVATSTARVRAGKGRVGTERGWRVGCRGFLSDLALPASARAKAVAVLVAVGETGASGP